MKLFELVDPNGLGYYDINKDELNTRQRDNTRKTKLMLRDVNKLKKIRALKRLKALQNQDVLEIMYGGSDEEDGGFGGAPAF